ncbi:zinc-ribbon domain-containing protein [Alicyclobacillus curvatus]|nr:zinc-ribbon domain-containing protein [Alicyclobacillus curvatus]
MSDIFRELFGGGHHGSRHGGHHGGHHEEHHHDRRWGEPYREGAQNPQRSVAVTKCPECGWANEVSSNFCSQCGTNLKPKPVQGSSCGTAVPTSASFCPNCGQKL